MKNQEDTTGVSHALKAEIIINSYLFCAEPLNFKKVLTKMFMDCMESDTEYTALQRREIVHVYNTLTEFIKNSENYRKSAINLQNSELC